MSNNFFHAAVWQHDDNNKTMHKKTKQPWKLKENEELGAYTVHFVTQRNVLFSLVDRGSDTEKLKKYYSRCMVNGQHYRLLEN